MTTSNKLIKDVADQAYKYGFVTEIETEQAPRGLNEEIVRWISAKKNEPEFMLEWRLKAYRHFFYCFLRDGENLRGEGTVSSTNRSCSGSLWRYSRRNGDWDSRYSHDDRRRDGA